MTQARPSPDTPDTAAWSALHESAVVSDGPATGALRLTGPDRVDFLNGQLAHDLRSLPESGSRRALYLDVKGHALDEVRVQRRAHDLHVVVEDGRTDAVRARLEAHRVFDDVTIEDLSRVLACLTVQGPESAAMVERAFGVAAPEEEGRFTSAPFAGAELLILRHARTGPGGVDVHLLRRDMERARDALLAAGATPADAELLEASRIEAGLARAAADAGPGVLPQEAGLDGAISTRKGCYLGQETMARIEARARLRRGLVRLRLAGVPSGADERPAVHAGEREVGHLGTVAHHPTLGTVGLAVMRHDVGDDATLSVGDVGAAILPG